MAFCMSFGECLYMSLARYRCKGQANCFIFMHVTGQQCIYIFTLLLHSEYRIMRREMCIQSQCMSANINIINTLYELIFYLLFILIYYYLFIVIYFFFYCKDGHGRYPCNIIRCSKSDASFQWFFILGEVA